MIAAYSRRSGVCSCRLSLVAKYELLEGGKQSSQDNPAEVVISLTSFLFCLQYNIIDFFRSEPCGCQSLAIACALSSEVAPEPRPGRLVPGSQYLSHQGCLDEPRGSRAFCTAGGSCTLVSHLPFLVHHVRESLPYVASSSPMG